MANFGPFLNEFTANPSTLMAVAGAVVLVLALFSWLYNGLMNRRKGENVYTAIYVVGGVTVTLFGAALISWKAALLVLVCFMASGVPMIIGDMVRSTKRQRTDNHKPKRLPYRANGLIKDAFDLLFDANHSLTELVERKPLSMEEMMRLVARIAIKVSAASRNLSEVRTINNQ
jgi:hypothetical protein